MTERWFLRRGEPALETLLQKELGVSPLLSRLLVQRGYTTVEAAGAFLNPRLRDGLRSPFLFRDMDKAVERVRRAIARKETVALYGDYDLDGVSGTAVLYCFFRDLGLDPIVHVPDRLREGYGLNSEAIRALHARGASLLITVDCGAANEEEIRFAQSLKMETIVCDHHQVPPRPLPAFATLNPAAPDCGFPFAGLCGAGIAFYLAWGVRGRLREDGKAAPPSLRELLDLVTLGTIADIMPLEQENRVLVRHGLDALARGHRVGIAALKSIARIEHVNSAAVSFRLAPRLNSSGRLTSALVSFNLLTTEDADRAIELAKCLDATNRERQALESATLQEALALCRNDPRCSERAAIVLASSTWHPGVVGIVAARLVQRFKRPAALIAIDPESEVGRGSVRGIAGVNCYRALADCASHLLGFGGHPMAAGFTIAAEKISDFASNFDEAVQAQLPQSRVLPIYADAEVNLSEFDPGSVTEALCALEPFGPANPEPVFFARNVRLRSSRPFGTGHLSLFIEQNGRAFPARWFQWGHEPPPPSDTAYDVLFTCDLGGGSTAGPLQLRLVGIRPTRH
ncbi:MAG: single-stranded-DNA-specific exonuclease RecJ [Candidatus Binatia bacterium]|nr:single-stranded-DNA-specific exonuclease RecJ [Candidatus Binatia bacterium]